MFIRYCFFVIFIIALLFIRLASFWGLRSFKADVQRIVYIEFVRIKGIGEKRAIERLLAM